MFHISALTIVTSFSALVVAIAFWPSKKAKPGLGESAIQQLEAGFALAGQWLGPNERFAIKLPTISHFPVQKGSTIKETIQKIVDFVLAELNLNIELQIRVGGNTSFESQSLPQVTLDQRQEIPTLHVSQGLLDELELLIAQLVPVLCHLIIQDFCPKKDLPYLADICAIHMGYGLFLCNATFIQHNVNRPVIGGWHMRSYGNLNCEETAHAFALWLQSKGLEGKPLFKYLNPNAKADLRNAIKHLASVST
ncbi:MAG: hypothetical protein H6510_15720 [Acidobacteria bacterium]|nr:hypothetical protein [Acidobacteriota bacterium]MCB9399260.1 hypothetical protein [Acidobacteriota bacterium]